MDFHWLNSTTSTNDVAKAHWRQHQRPALFAANHQTSGRGTQGRVWHSPKGCGLYLSLVMPFQDQAYPATQIVAGLVCHWLVSQGWQGLGLKPVNDIMWGHKKLGGILVERLLEGHQSQCLIVGVGLNLFTPKPLLLNYPEHAVALDALPQQPNQILTPEKYAFALGKDIYKGLLIEADLLTYQYWVNQWQKAVLSQLKDG